jgi:uncharacterized membrane protein
MLVVISLVYWLTPRESWAVALFLSLAVFYLAWAIAWASEYWKLQRIASRLLFAAANLFVGIALLFGSILTMQPEAERSETLRLISRICWLVSFVPMSIAVYKECWRIGRGLRAAWLRWHGKGE